MNTLKLKLGLSTLSVAVLLMPTPSFSNLAIDKDISSEARNLVATKAADRIVDAMEHQFRVIGDRETLLPDGSRAPHLRKGRVYNAIVKDILGKVTAAAMATGPLATVPGALHASFSIADMVPLLNEYIDHRIKNTLKDLAKDQLTKVMESDSFYKTLSSSMEWNVESETSSTQRQTEWEALNDFFKSSKESDRQILSDLEGESSQEDRLPRYWKEYIGTVVKQTVRNTLKAGTGMSFDFLSKALLNEMDSQLKSHSQAIAISLGSTATVAAWFNPISLVGIPGAYFGKRLADRTRESLIAKLDERRKATMESFATDLSWAVIAPSQFEIFRPDRKITSTMVQEHESELKNDSEFVKIEMEEATLTTYATQALRSATTTAKGIATKVVDSFSQLGSALYNWWNPPAKKEEHVVQVGKAKIAPVRDEKKGLFHRITGKPFLKLFQR